MKPAWATGRPGSPWEAPADAEYLVLEAEWMLWSRSVYGPEDDPEPFVPGLDDDLPVPPE